MTVPHEGHAAPRAGAKTSPVRLAVLLVILAVAVGALIYDQMIASPAAIAAGNRLTKEAEAHNSTGYDDSLTLEEKKQRLASGVLGPKDVQRIIGRSPTRVVTANRHVIEYYRWWGYVPFNRHYVSVIYLGKEPNLRYQTHYTNRAPSAEELPGYVHKAPPQDLSDVDADAAGGMPPAAGPGGPGGGKGKGKGKGKGGGKGQRPPGEATEEGSDSEPAPPSEAKDDEKPASEKQDDDAGKESSESAGDEKSAASPPAETKSTEPPADEKAVNREKDE